MSNERLYTPVHRTHVDWLRGLPVAVDGEGLRLGSQYVMFFAEDELMRIHAELLLTDLPHAHVLEVGLGLGVFAGQTTGFDLASYTAIEVHPSVAALSQASVLDRLCVPVTMHIQPWQLVPLTGRSFDAIMYDTWPPDGLADEDFARFIEHVAIPCLRPGGRFSFFYSGSQLSQRRAKVLDEAFPGWSMRHYTLPADRTPRGWTKPTREFIVPIATKGTA